MKGLRKIKVNRDGYTKEGSYFGAGQGLAPLYESDEFGYFRAATRKEAIAKVKGWQQVTPRLAPKNPG